MTTPPDGARWTRLRAAVEGALLLPADTRAAFLDALCAGDDALRADADRLLDGCVRAGESASFFREAAAEYAAPILASASAATPTAAETFARLRDGLADTYDVEREIGAGGMATVYLARDRKHDRPVAIKVLRPELAASLGAERFLTEIRVTANLQHPNLLSLFDSGEVNGLLYYVMPFVEGESLRARLDRERQLPIDDAVRIAVAVAGALDYAHRRGVVHRDLKPDNILLHEGDPLVADFGIALALSSAGADRVTQTGLSLGTPSYMSPEQAGADRTIDARSDIYSLGCVLYEMLAGEPPHTGASVQAIIARIMTEEPRHLRVERPSVPEHVDAAVQRALAKVPADRYATAREFANALEGRVGATLAVTPRASRPMPKWLRDPVRVSLGVACIVLFGAAAMLLRRTPPAGTAGTARFVISSLTDAPREGAPTITPDGQNMVYVGSASTRHAILVRRIDELGARPLAGTEGAVSAFVSLDGKRIGFFTTDDKLKTVPIDGGVPTTVTSLFRFTRAIWTPGGEIIADGFGNGLVRISDGGGKPVGITRVNEASGESRHASPVLDGAGNVLFTVVRRRGGPGTVIGDIAVAALDAKSNVPQPHHAVGVSGRQIIAVVDGLLLYVSGEGTSIVAVPYDRTIGKTTAKPMVVLQDTAGVFEGVSLATNGTLLYTRRKATNAPMLVDVNGVARPLLGAVAGKFMNPRLSPDGTRLAIQDASPQGNDVWVYDIASHTPTRLTTSGNALLPSWTPDGRYLVFAAQEKDGSLARVRADSGGAEERLANGEGALSSTVTHDGRSVIFERRVGGTWSVWKTNLAGTDSAVALVKDTADSYMPSVSPDGRWLAYLSDISGRHEVYVRPFAGAGAPDQISTNGGTEPLWAADGKHLYYRAEGQFVEATLALGVRAAVTARRSLFPDSYDGDMPHADYDVLRDGKGFVTIAAGAGASPETVVILNWLSELRERLKQ